MAALQIGLLLLLRGIVVSYTPNDIQYKRYSTTVFDYHNSHPYKSSHETARRRIHSWPEGAGVEALAKSGVSCLPLTPTGVGSGIATGGAVFSISNSTCAKGHEQL